MAFRWQGVGRDHAHHDPVPNVEALEIEASGLRNDLGVAMDALNASKEKTGVLIEQLEPEK